MSDYRTNPPPSPSDPGYRADAPHRNTSGANTVTGRDSSTAGIVVAIIAILLLGIIAWSIWGSDTRTTITGTTTGTATGTNGAATTETAPAPGATGTAGSAGGTAGGTAGTTSP